jgi:TonB family protein
MQQKHDDAAVAQFSAILAQPNLPISASTPARYGRAMLYVRNRRADDALADVNAALALTPKDARMLVARAYVYFMRADFKHALEDCNVALEDSPGNAFGLHVRANDSMEMGQYQDAVRDYTAELQVMKDPAAHVLRAVAYHRLGRESDAMSDIAQADANGDKTFKAMYDSIANASSATKSEVSNRVKSSGVDPVHAFNEPGVSAPTAANDHQSYYPPLSVLLGESGSAKVGIEIAADGSVSNPVIEKSSGFPMLDAAALESVKSWRYNPARRDGKPVGCHYSANIYWMGN